MAGKITRKITKALSPKKEEGYVFEAEGSAFSEDELLSIKDESYELGHDPSFLTEKIIEFGLILTGIPLYEYQKEAIYRIIYSVVAFEGETITALWARQSGKTEALSFIVDSLCVILPSLAKVIPTLGQFKNGIRIGLFAPQSDQVVTTYTRALSRLKSENAELIMADPEIDTGLEYDSRLALSNGSSLTGQTAGKTSKIESKTYDLVFIEEAQDMDDFLVQKSIEPMVTATAGTIVKVGTTGTRKCDFFYEIQRNIKRGVGKHSGKMRFHFEYNYLDVIRQKRKQFEVDRNPFHLNYERFIAKQIDKRGKNSDSFKLSYALIWDLESGMFLTDRDWNNIINKKRGFVRVVEDNWDVRAGLDLAKENASTVLTIAKVFPVEEFKPPRKEVLRFIELHGMNYELQHELILEALIEYNVNTVYVDATGVGKPIADRLLHACGHYVNVVPYTFSRPSKSEMWLALKADIDAKRLMIPANNAARETEEYRKCEFQMKGMNKWYEGGYLVAQKSEESEFDDYCDSLGLMTLAGNVDAEVMEEIMDENNPFFPGSSDILDTINKMAW